MILRNTRRIYLWIGIAALALGLAIIPASGVLASLPAQKVASPPMPASGQQARPATGMPATGSTALTKPAIPSSILYDQYNNFSGNAVSSQDFEAANDDIDDQAADDFVVPAGPGWRITQVDVNGTYSAGSGFADLTNVYFYSNAVSGTYSIPAAAVYTATNLSTITTTAGSLVIPLTTPAVLAPGTYWVSVQARMDSTDVGGRQWFWQDRTVQSTGPAAWRNPGGGFGTACTTTWDRRDFCVGVPPQPPDQIFRLWGDPVGAPTSTNTPTPLPTATRPACGGGANWIVGNPFPSTMVRGLGVWFTDTAKFYVLGGRSADAAGNELLNPRIFTPGGQGTWSIDTAVFNDNQVNNMVGGVLNQGGTNYIFTVGGSISGAATTSMQVRRFDPVNHVITVIATDPWPLESPTLLPGGSAVVNNKLYVFGGFDVGTIVGSDQIWEFDPNGADGSRWTLQSTVLPVPMAYIPVTAINPAGTPYIYIGGGTELIAGSLVDSQNSYRYDPVADSITTIAQIPRATGETKALNVNGQMWVLGGGRVSPNPSNEVDVYFPLSDTWTTVLSFVNARRNFAVDSRPGTGDRVYLVGGYEPTSPAADMEIYVEAAPCINTFTPSSTPTKTNTRTATPTFCPPVLRSIGPGDPGKVGSAIQPANASNDVAAAAGGGKSVRAGKLPENPANASAAFELDDGTREGSIGFGSTANNTESAAIWLNRFSPPNGAYPITLSKVHILWPAQSPTLTDTIIGKTARLLIYRANAPGAPITNTTLMYQQFVTVGVTETFQTYNLTSPPTIAGVNGEDLYIGFEDFWAESGSFQPRFFPAAQDTTPPSQVRSWVVGNGNAGPPNVADLGDPVNDTVGTIDSFGLPGNWMIRANGSTSLPDPCPATRTPTPLATPQLVVHILFQGIPTPNPVKYITDTVTTTLRLASGGPNIEYGPIGPDGFGFYTIPVGSLPSGTYIIRAKGYKNLSSGTTSCDTVTLTGALITQKDLANGGTTPLRAGDALTTGPTNFNVVNASDFTTLKNTFGKAFGQPGYDNRADFNQSDNVDASDFSLQKGNFGSAGCPNP